MQDRPYPPSDEASAPLEEETERDATDAEELDEDEVESEEGDALAELPEVSAEALAPETPPPPEAPPDTELIPEPDVELDTTELYAEAAASGEQPEIDPASLDPDALKVVHRLRSFGHQAYFVGGCVRDLLLGRKPKDFDIATSAHPGEVRAVFRNCRLIGRRFRLAHVYFKGGKIIEVATFRANPGQVEPPEENGEAAEASDNGSEDLLISDDNVFGTDEQDARRRDFTINGLFYDVGTGKVIDYVRGRRDLEQRYMRTIGDPEIRMREDPVRILRAVRFACRLDFDIESRTYAAMEGAVEELPRCAPPRLLEDTFRIIRGGISRPGIHLLYALDALKYLLPPVDAFLKEQGKAGETLFNAYADALDQKLKSGAQLEDAVLLAALLLPIAETVPPAESEDNRPAVAKPIEDLLSELVRTARLPRRIAERCRMILFAQKTLSGERRRRGSLQSFRRHPLFNESLVVFEIAVAATGKHQDALQAWLSGSAPQASATPEGGSPSGRRRRRRRRRRGGPPGEGSEDTSSAPPPAEGGEG